MLYTGKNFSLEPAYDKKIVVKKNAFHLLATGPILTIYHHQLYFHDSKLLLPIKNFESFLQDFMLANFIDDSTDKTIFPYPYQGGLLGMFSYDYKNHLPHGNFYQQFPEKFPAVHLVLYANITLYPYRDASPSVYQPATYHIRQRFSNKTIQTLQKKGKSDIRNTSYTNSSNNNDNGSSSLKGYKNMVQTIKNHIKDGIIYQVNVSRKVTGSVRSSSIKKILYNALTQNPSPYSAVTSTPHGYVLSTSPESFFHYQPILSNKPPSKRRAIIATRPIKGTIGCAVNAKKDARNKNALLRSQKDLSELTMIVDLMRNDLNTVCQVGNVTVAEYPILRSYCNVHHLHALILGNTNKSAFKVLNALFPGGSITGCPKIKACQIIDELEAESRGIYTGCLGYFSWTGDAEFSLLIRSAHLIKASSIKNKKANTSLHTFEYRVGGGITLLSNKKHEIKETISKEATLKKVFRDE